MTIESPCINVCQLSEDRSVCTGCHRSLSDIANWRLFTDAEKLRAIAAAHTRRVALASGPAFVAPPCPSASATRIKTCPECGETFGCKPGGCWCDDFPPLPLPTTPGAECLCPECLGRTVERLRAGKP